MSQENSNPYETGLDKNAANYVPLSPTGFLLRSAAVYPNRTAVIHGKRRYTWKEALERCRRLASALAKRGVRPGDTVAVMAPNVPALFEAHFGVPMVGAILNALNYTSGTTGNPKGVVYHHRGAYLNALGNILSWSMPQHPVYLWTLPMFHCNGWCFPWTVTALAGTHVCLRRVEAGAIYDAIEQSGVTHLCGAPVVMNMLLNARNEPLPRPVHMMTAGAAPPAAVIGGMERLGFNITHVYGLTEVYGPAVVCAWHDEWDALSDDERARLKARQGVTYPVLDGLMVGDPETLVPVPSDGTTMGEIFFRGNIVMKAYLKNPAATEEAFAGGWFRSGDLAVMHEDGYIEIKDRSKDIISAGGENISTIEVEDVLYRHPAVLEAAVVAKPDPNWGETPCAFVTLKDGARAEAADIIAFCREHIARFKAPRHVVFCPLPKTSTVKIQKFVQSDRANSEAATPN